MAGLTVVTQRPQQIIGEQSKPTLLWQQAYLLHVFVTPTVWSLYVISEFQFYTNQLITAGFALSKNELLD